jgi:hypothetical protein
VDGGGLDGTQRRGLSRFEPALGDEFGDSESTASLIRVAAFPVGAASATRKACPRSSANLRAVARIRATVWVFPVPGPPARTVTGWVSARRAATNCRSVAPSSSTLIPPNTASSAASTSASPPSVRSIDARPALRAASWAATSTSKDQNRWR